MNTKRTKSSNRSENTNNHHWLHVLPWSLVTILAVILLVAWWGPISKAFGDWFDGVTPKQAVSDSTKPTSVTVSTTPGGGSGGTTIMVPLGTSGGGASSGGSSGGSSTSGGSGGNTPPPPVTGGTLNLKDLYSSIATGQTKQQLIDLAGGNAPDNCTATQILLLGTQQVCTWTDNNGTVVVTMVNDQVVAKQSVGI